MRRWREHKNSDPRQHILHRSFLKYGVINHSFEIIQEFPIDIDQEILDWCEQFYMDHYRKLGIKLLNIKEGGSHGKHSSITKQKMSKIHLNRERKHVYQYSLEGEFIKEYKSIPYASKICKIDEACIRHCCNGKQKSAGKFIWFNRFSKENIDTVINNRENSYVNIKKLFFKIL